MGKITLALLVVATAGILGACGGSRGDRPTAQNGAKVYAVSSEAAPFYRYGPQQGSGPDRTLPRDTLVKLIRPSFGYCKVQVMEDKQQGYVAAEDLRVAPANLVAAANATPAPVVSSRASSSTENFDLSDPALRATQEQLPPPDLPASADSSTPVPAPSPM